MSQHDFNIANQLFPATRADLNSAFVALASNSSGDAEPTTTYANQWWYETDTNTLKLRNEANNAWIPICVLDQSNNNVLSITTQGLTLGATAITASGADINVLDGLARGSIIYGNNSGVTSELVKGAANTVLTSDGTDISWSDGPPTLTRGQIIYSNPSGTTAALSPGTSGQVLTSDGTDISWSGGVGLQKVITTPLSSWSTGTSYTFTHNLGTTPAAVIPCFTAKSANNGYSTGDVIMTGIGYRYAGWGVFVNKVATNTVQLLVGSPGIRWHNPSGSLFYIQNSTYWSLSCNVIG